MRNLVLMRHAQAEEHGTIRDFDRVLTRDGRDDAKRMGDWLIAHGYPPDTVVASPAPRAIETARIASGEMHVKSGMVRAEPEMWDATPQVILRMLGQCEPVPTVWFVGHNPGIEAVAVHLTGDADLARRGLAMGGVVAMQVPDDWRDLGARCATGWVKADPSTVPWTP